MEIEQLAPDDVRRNLTALVERHDTSLASLSRMLGRNPAYLQQFVARGSPERLPERDRLMLAQFFGVDERLLGAREPWKPLASRAGEGVASRDG